MAPTLPGGISLPTFWTLYAAMGGLAALLAGAWFAAPAGRVRGFVEGIFGLFTMAQISVLALAVRREGMEPVATVQAAHFPGVPLYALVLAPLGLTLVSLLAISFRARRLNIGWSTPDAIVIKGEALDMPEEARLLYGLRETVRTDIGFAVAVCWSTLVALNVHGPWAAPALLALGSLLWLAPVIVSRIFGFRFARFEQREANADLLRAARAASGAVGVPVDAAIVDAGPEGFLHMRLALRKGVLTVSRKLLKATTPEECDFLLRRTAEYEADRAGRATARAWYAAAFLCPVAGVLWFVLAGTAARNAGAFTLAFFGLVSLLVLWLVLWFGVARGFAVQARLHAGNRALDATRNLTAALSAVRKCGNQADDPNTANGIFFDPRPTVDQQVRALRAEAARLGLPLPPEPPHRGGLNLGIPFHRG